MKYQDQYETIIEAAKLLNAPLVWSEDMDQIRRHLASMLEHIAEGTDPEQAAQELAAILISDTTEKKKMPKIPVTVYTTSNCVQCMQTKKTMDKYGIHYSEVSLEENPALLEQFKAAGHLSAPIVTTDIKVWSGFRLAKIKSLADHINSNRGQ